MGVDGNNSPEPACLTDMIFLTASLCLQADKLAGSQVSPARLGALITMSKAAGPAAVRSVLQPAACKPATTVRSVHQASDLASSTAWRPLGTPSEELRLEFTLPTGQSFRWRDMGEGLFTGVVGNRVVS